ncbi:MAG: glycoside hydrolase family 47 protein [Longimicrobiales bacterium]|nr:glycoside hydrolase family 47 protein [Longimicrobiales bacterium]
MGFGRPTWLEKDFRAYLRCGIHGHGFGRARCDDRCHKRLIPFPCKARGICPSSNTRLGALLSAYQMEGDPRWLDLATDLADRLLPAFASPTGLPYVG